MLGAGILAKVNFLAIAVLFVSLILIANAAEENASESYNTIDEISNLSYSNGTAADNSYGLNNTETIADNKPIEANNSAENAAQNNLSNVNEDNVDNTSYLNEMLENNNTNLSGTLTAENENISIEENQNATNEIAAEVFEGLTADAPSNATGSEGEGTSVTASFGVYLEIVG